MRRVLAAIVVLTLAGCAGTTVPASSPSATSVPSLASSPSPSPVQPQPLLGNGNYAAHSIGRVIDVWKSAGSGTMTALFDTRNSFGQRVAMEVTKAKADAAGDPWYEVLLPIRPNGTTGWVKGSDVRLQQVRDRIVVDISKRTLDHFRGKRLVDEFSVGVGRPEFPTATGSFYIWARVPQASPFGPYGVYALGLSGFSDVLTDWPGGGRMAIHGTANAADRGAMVSHGCVRVYNPDMLTLKHLPLGTPVLIKQ